ncbi:ankyrin repeat-containing protein At2g01680-like [Rhododendron vialii]|uniref:ankyrin repeat-containing protein At2g01680-like n=1 Tax=Rhododendron vialii TaxID=182163 RepID=UPI00265FAE3C|nr:ankyrin repeat-containing protein At2g01680-like [Rhododendron vialii]
MEERLCYAAMKGDLKSLQEIIAIDGSILDRVLVGIFRGKNPLHVAISTGQTRFVLKLLEIKPGLAEVLDTELGAAIHIASAKGHLEIVKALVNVSPEMCLARDGDGNSPVHIAALKGQLQVLEELVRTNSHIAQVKVNRGDTILHLCVKYDQFECLKLLLQMNPDPCFVNDVDVDGNTILHLAVFKKRPEMIKLVLSCKNIVAVNAINKSGRSPLDIHLQFRSENQSDSEIEDILLDAGAKRFKRGKQGTVGDDRLEPSWQTKRRNTFMIVSSLIATMAYQVGVNPPGGVWLDDAEGHKVGKAILAYNYPDFYPIFMCLNTAGFLVSLTTILLLIISLPERGWGLRWAQAFISWCTILTTAFSYTFSVIAISPAGKRYIYIYDRDASKVIKFTAMAWAFVMSLLFVWHLLHLTIGILKEQRGLMKCMGKLFKVVKGRPTSLPN